NVATGFSGIATFTTSDGQASLPSAYAFTAADAGSHTFTNGVTLKTAGTHSVTATSGAVTGAETGIVVTAASAMSFVVSGISSPRTAGVASDLTVKAFDAFGNVATGFTGTTTLTSSDGQAALPGAYAFTAGDAGIHTFTNGVTL